LCSFFSAAPLLEYAAVFERLIQIYEHRSGTVAAAQVAEGLKAVLVEVIEVAAAAAVDGTLAIDLALH